MSCDRLSSLDHEPATGGIRKNLNGVRVAARRTHISLTRCFEPKKRTHGGKRYRARLWRMEVRMGEIGRGSREEPMRMGLVLRDVFGCL